MYSAAVGGEGAVALQLREAPPDLAAAHHDRLAICHQPALLADLLHAATDIGKFTNLKPLHPESIYYRFDLLFSVIVFILNHLA